MKFNAAIPDSHVLSATLPEGLFLKALTEGLHVTRPGAVDICGAMMARYSIIYRVAQ
jgi:hypothetical protein